MSFRNNSTPGLALLSRPACILQGQREALGLQQPARTATNCHPFLHLLFTAQSSLAHQ